MNIKDLKGVQEILKRKDRSEKRLKSFDLFKSRDNHDRIHGLGLKTNVGFVNLDDLEVGFDKLKGYPEDVFDDQKVIFLNGEEILSFEGEGKDKIISALDDIVAKDKIDDLHDAVNETLLVYVKKDLVLDTIILDKLLSKNSFNHTIFYFGKHVKVSVLYHVKSCDGDFVGTEFCNILVDDGADVLFTLVKDLGQGYYLHNRNFNKVFDNGNLHFVTADFGGKLIVTDSHTVLKGRGSNADTDNLFYGMNGEEFDVNGSSIHANKNTSSLITLKGVLEDSKAMTRGLVKIEENAPDSNGYQKSDILLLDDKSKAVSIPDLLIHNDQVKCSHGSTISHLEEEKVFYLQSRGLSKLDAMRKLVEGFYFPVIDKIRSQQIKEVLVSKVEARIYEK